MITTNLMNNGSKPVYPDPMRGAEQNYVNQSPGELNVGLTKREYFAAMAMQGILAKESWAERIIGEGGERAFSESIAYASVKMADELLKQLEP